MLNMLIADDEKVIRESIAACLDWESLGVRLIGCCANGLEALEIIIDEAPDIVMTDIKMPGLDGLELIDKIHSIDKDVEFIILSGYREFDFAQRAMEYGIRRYLLKPVGTEQVRDAVLDAVQSCEQKRSVRAAMEEHRAMQQQMDHYYSRQIQYSLFLSAGQLQQAVEVYCEHFSGQIGYFAGLSLSPLQLEEAAGLVRAMAPRLEQLGLVSVTGFLFAGDSLATILRGGSPRQAAAAAKCAAGLAPQLRADAVDEASLVGGAQRLQKELVRFSHVYTVDEGGDAHELYGFGLPLEAMQALPEQLVALAQDGARAEAEEQIRAYLGAIEGLHTLRAAGAHLLSGILVHQRLAAEKAYAGVFDDIYREDERGALADKVAQTALALLWEGRGENDLVQKVKYYVTSNLADSNLTLKLIAEQYVHVNVDYLSRLFVQETGEKFSHYLNRKRVEKAKQLLQGDSSKVFQVAEQVGLGHNPRYFGQVFKKYTGTTPSRYAGGQGD